MAEDRVLEEIRDLLKEQNRLVAELKAQNELALLVIFGASVIGQLAR